MKNPTQRLLLGGALATVATTLLMACNKAPEEAPVVTPPSMSMGTQIDDSIITASVKSALLANPDINSFDLQVETRKGIVQLSGFVNSAADIQHAVQLVQGTSGVRSVRNDMRLK